jgi:hypothetical protein
MLCVLSCSIGYAVSLLIMRRSSVFATTTIPSVAKPSKSSGGYGVRRRRVWSSDSQNWVEIEPWGKAKAAWLAEFLDFAPGLPSHDVDPDNRLVASERERRWTETLAQVAEVEARLATLASQPITLSEAQPHGLLTLRDKTLLPATAAYARSVRAIGRVQDRSPVCQVALGEDRIQHLHQIHPCRRMRRVGQLPCPEPGHQGLCVAPTAAHVPGDGARHGSRVALGTGIGSVSRG